jgi:6-phosphogluconolactonase
VPSTAKGIYVFKMDGRTGGLKLIQIEENIENPSWVAVDASASHLYATSEVTTWRGQADTGGVTAHSISSDGTITVINDQPTQGSIPAHVVVDPSGKFILIANYIGANFGVRQYLPVAASVQPRTCSPSPARPSVGVVRYTG